MKNPLTPAGIEQATYRFVAQHLNHCATAVPNMYIYIYKLQMSEISLFLPVTFFLLPCLHGVYLTDIRELAQLHVQI